MTLFDKVWQQMNTRLDQAKLSREAERYRQALLQNPNDTEALRQLGTLYQMAGMAEEAIQCFVRLAELYHQNRQSELAIAYYRKVERMGDNERRASILKEIVRIHQSLGQFEEAYRAARQVNEVYLSMGQKEAARGFVNSLPSFGEKDEVYRKELREMVGERDESWAQGAKGTWRDQESAQVQQAVPLAGFQQSKVVPTSSEEQALFSEMTILIVDDDPNIILLLGTAIKTLGCQVITASNGVEGIDKALRLRPNLIISDLLMPKMDGSQFFSKLQEYPETAAIPFVCLTSRGQEEEKLAAFQKGVEDYWVKPFSIAEVTLRVKKLLQRQLQQMQIAYASASSAQAELSGNLSDMTPADLLRFMEAKRKTGIARFRNGEAEGTITFYNGTVIDAQYASLVGEPALYTLLNWVNGSFTFVSQMVSVPRTIFASTNEILAQMMQRYDEEYYLIEQLPPPNTTLALSYRFNEALKEVSFPRSIERLIILFDGRNTLGECLEQLRGDTEAIRLLVELYHQGLIVDYTAYLRQ
ncbi:MAG: response regulator [Acidobacteriota bacterium]|nr:response regulator [Blastocatellia bacterium]MDW8412183.1 response regulator [Acidobacteriota bacterium]